MTLLEFKKSGPWIRIGNRSLAQKRFDAICGTLSGFERLCVARDAYAQEVGRMFKLKRSRGETAEEINHYVLHLCTFLARWEDYFEERTELLHDEPEPQSKPNANLTAAKDFVSRRLAETLLFDMPDVRKDPR